MPLFPKPRDPGSVTSGQRISWAFVFKFGVSIGCLIWVFWGLREVDLRASFAGLADAHLGLVAASLGMVVALYLSRLLRLRYWAGCVSAARLTWPQWIELYLKSMALGAFTPSRIGEFSRIPLLAPSGLPLGKRARLVFLDKFSDLLYVPLAVFFTMGVVEEVFSIPVLWSCLGGGALVVGFLGVSFWFKHHLVGLVLWRGWVATVIGFAAFVLSNVGFFRAVGIALSWQEVLAVIVTVGMLAALPLSIAGIGVREGSLLAILGAWGVPEGQIPPVLFLEFLVNVIFPMLLLLIWKLFAKLPRGDRR